MELLVLIASGAAGAVAGRFLRLPMWPITGALLGSAAAHIALGGMVDMPPALSFFAQILVGCAVGASVMPGFMKQLGSLILPAAIVAFTLVIAGISCAIVMIWLGFIGPDEALLGMVPGGVGEMVAASSALGANSAMVAGIHVVRLLVTLWLLPVLVRWAMHWRPRTSREEET